MQTNYSKLFELMIQSKSLHIRFLIWGAIALALRFVCFLMERKISPFGSIDNDQNGFSKSDRKILVGLFKYLI